MPPADRDIRDGLGLGAGFGPGSVGGLRYRDELA